MVDSANVNALDLSEEEAYSILVKRLKELVVSEPSQGSLYNSEPAFDIVIQDEVVHYLKQHKIEYSQGSSKVMPSFYSAAWELCLRGVLRPSFKSSPNQPGHLPTNGYSITERGMSWLLDDDGPHFTAIGEFARQLAKSKRSFGAAYHERAQEAVKAYFAGAYLACCAMCGAASESILLNLAIRKVGDEEQVLKAYNGRSGRKYLRDQVLNLQSRPDSIKSEVGAGFTILAYWRDDAAHGSARRVDATQACIALQLLCLFVIAVEKNWDFLVAE